MNLIYYVVTIVDNIVLYNWNLLNVEPQCSRQYKTKTKNKLKQTKQELNVWGGGCIKKKKKNSLVFCDTFMNAWLRSLFPGS